MTANHSDGHISTDDDAYLTITTRADIIARIEARLNQQISDEALAQWAFSRFYAEEIGAEDYEAGVEPLVAEVLDTLMFGDDPSFRLNEEELRDLLARLRNA